MSQPQPDSIPPVAPQPEAPNTAPGMAPPPPPPPMYPQPPAAPHQQTDAGMPRSVKAARIVMFVGAGLTIVVLIAAIMMGASATQLGYVVGSTLPGYLALVVAFGLSSGKKGWWIAALFVAAFWILGALGSLGRGDLRGVAQMALPIAVLALLLQEPSRRFFAKKS